MHNNRTRAFISVFLLAIFASSQVFFPLMVLAEENADTTALSSEITTGSLALDSASATIDTPAPDALSADTPSVDSSTTTDTTVVSAVSDVSTSSQSGFIEPFVVASSSPATSTPLFFGITPDLPSDLSSSTPPQIPDSGVYDEPGATSTPSNASSTDNGLSPRLSPIATSNETASSTATSTQSRPVIQSGTAVAMANVLNILNASFLNSLGSIIFSNYLKKANTIDLRDPSDFSGLCGDSLCKGDESIMWNLSQDGYVKNDIAISATSGQNEISSEDGGAITTGDSYAGLNLINLVNSVFSHSEYLLAAINAFNGVTGDIVFPGLDKFLGSSSGSGGGSFESFATVTNNASSSADSGNNEIGENSALQTGAAQAYTNVYNQVNSFLPGNGVTILMRLSGTWTGQIFGAPPGLEVIHGPDGSMYLFGTLGGSGTGSPMTDVYGTSTAEIENNVSTAALSGQNKAGGGASLITTGNAYAGANIVNIANQHVIGKNWLLAIINIFGDFNGNIAFGRPDLWVGDKVSGPAFIQDGSTLSYKMTVINNGDADAHNVKLSETPDMLHGEIASSSISYATTTTGVLSFDLGTIPKGKAVEITYEMTVKNTSPGTPITNKTTVTLEETDNNTADNSDTTTITTSVQPTGGGGSYYIPASQPSNSQISNNSGGSHFPIITAERHTASTTLSRETATTTQNLSIKNETNIKATGVVIHDILKNPAGDIINDEYYDLGDIAAKEEVIVDYDITFGPQAPAGMYTLETKIEGHNIASRTIVNGTILLLSTPTTLSFLTSDATSTSPVVTGEIRHRTRVAPTTSTGLSSTTLVSLVRPRGEDIPRQSLLANAFSTGNVPTSVTMLALTIILGALAYIGKIYLPKNIFKA